VTNWRAPGTQPPAKSRKILAGRLNPTQVGAMSDNPPPPSFEESLGKLEKLVATLESGDVPLADLVTRYTEGTRLLQQCQASLRAAELVISELPAAHTES
jgi:exodeoxyribonuclease VII small subunit